MAYAKLAPTMRPNQSIVITLSGRGDKDVAAIARYRGRISMIKIADAFQNGKAFPFLYYLRRPRSGNHRSWSRPWPKQEPTFIELGIPFSDPTAEGPVIQAGNLRALKAGTTTDKVFELVESCARPSPSLWCS